MEYFIFFHDNSTSKFNYGKGDYEKLRYSLDIDWVYVFNSFGNDVDKMWDYFKNELLLNVQKYIPIASNFRQWKKPSWKCPVSVNLQGLIKKKSRLWKRFIETRNPQTHKDYKKVRNEIRKQTREDVVFTKEAILDKLANIKINKSPGPDLLHPRVLHEARYQLVTPLRLLFEKSYTTGTLPHDWKVASTAPI